MVERYPLVERATRPELEAAWTVLRAAEVKVITDLSLGEVARLANDNNYARTGAETNLARGLLIVRAALAELQSASERFRDIACTCHQEDIAQWPCRACSLRDVLDRLEES